MFVNGCGRGVRLDGGGGQPPDSSSVVAIVGVVCPRGRIEDRCAATSLCREGPGVKGGANPDSVPEILGAIEAARREAAGLLPRAEGFAWSPRHDRMQHGMGAVVA